MKSNYLVLNFLVILVISIGIFIYFSGFLDNKKSPEPETTFKLITGKSVTLGSFKGKPVLVVFWATTCKICIKEIPDLIELHNRYSKRGLEIIAVAMPYDHPAAVVSLAKKMKLPYKVALDVDSKVLNAFVNVQVTPTIFLIANEGHIVMRAVGKLKLGKVSQLIEDEIKISTSHRQTPTRK